jgi:hypothetical protein
MKFSKNNPELFAGWTLEAKEVSNGVTFFEMTDSNGCQVSCKDDNYERGLNNCISFAFDVEKQISRNWNKFLYELFKYELNNLEFIEDKYSELVFGSWIISLEKKRIILDGKESELILQKKNIFKNWSEVKSIKLNNVTFENITELKNFILDN